MQPPSNRPEEHPKTSTTLVVGIVSVFVWIFGPVAWVLGNQTVREINAQPNKYTNRSTAQAGRILGIVSSCLLAFATIAWVGLFVAATSTTDRMQTSSGFNGNSGLLGSDASACASDTKTLKTAMLAWNTEYLAGQNPAFATPWPTSHEDMLYGETRLLSRASPLHRLEPGNGSEPLVIVKAEGRCSDEGEILQLTN